MSSLNIRQYQKSVRKNSDSLQDFFTTFRVKQIQQGAILQKAVKLKNYYNPNIGMKKEIVTISEKHEHITIRYRQTLKKEIKVCERCSKEIEKKHTTKRLLEKK